MKRILKAAWRTTRRLIWAIGVAYMLAFHNVYYDEQKYKEDIVIVVEEDTEIQDAAPGE
ncbi:hypothetical protein [Tunicatimonas pelagia]|uniref:hypothetical protein n=1 Tax=Tunicatimonas pelagia TaxID=931531 RepID=UPI002666A176|nr:hypothetical protein [Tunicatimonas pelagia]WKN42692.1 hypothetical protein P0M28_27010 [Tunicatimonas pelagia]